MRRTTFPTLAAVTAAITAAVTGCGGGPSCPEDALPGLCVAPARTVAIGRGIADVAALDLDGDGVDEWIAISEDAPALRIYRGGALRTAPLAGEPSALAVGDLDGDGHLGVAVALRSGDAVAIFTREGDGDLVQAALHPVGRSPRDLWLGDLDGDGRPELVTADAGDASLSILDGADRARRSVAAGEAPVQVAAGDLDGDGRLDLLVHDYADGAILGLRGREGGRLRPAERLLGAAGLASFAAGDLDGDGLVDLALQRDVDRRVAVHFADGAGGLGPAMELDPGFSDVPGVALVPAADGDPGAVVTASGDALYTWPIDPVRTVRPPELAADGASTIAAALLPLGGGALLLGDDHRAVIQGLTPELRLTPTWDRPSPDAPHVYVSGEPGFGDLDGDGEVDLVVNTWRDGVLTFHGDGRGGFTPGAMVPAPPGYFIAVADVSGDGRPDLVIAAADVLWIAVQADDGGFVPAEKIDLRADSEDMVALRGADRARIAVDVGPEGIDVFTLDGAGGLVAVITPRPGLSSSRLRAGDLDGDGDDDLVILGALDGVRGLTSLLSEGTGFLDGPLHREDDLLGDDLAAAEDVALGDLDGDGDLDAAIAAPDRVVRVLDPGADAPTIAVDPITYAPPIRWGPLSLGDVDGDRHLDLLRPQEGTLVLHRGRPGAGFDPEPELRIFSAEPRILPADLRRDARVDFVTKDERELRAFVGEVAPVAHERAALDLAPRFEALRLGDLDGDGAPELVARAARGVAVLVDPEGPGDAMIAELDLDDLRALAIADWDDDGVDEVILARADAGLEVGRLDDDALRRAPLGLADDPALARVRDLDAIDLDGDGAIDLLVGLGDPDGLAIARGDGEGGVEALEPIPSAFPGRVDAGDLDGDGRLDLLIAGVDRHQILWQEADGRLVPGFAREGVARLRPDGALIVAADGRLLRVPIRERAPITPLVLAEDPALEELSQFSLGDLDGDGVRDLVTVRGGEATLWLDRSGALLRATTRTIGGARDLRILDLDRRGRADLVGVDGEGLLWMIPGEAP